MKEQDPKIRIISFNSAIVVGIIAFIAFLYFTQQLFNPLVIFLIGLFVITPFRKESYFVRRMLLLFVSFFVLWIFTIIGSSIAPFIISFIIAYLLAPLVSALEKKENTSLVKFAFDYTSTSRLCFGCLYLDFSADFKSVQ